MTRRPMTAATEVEAPRTARMVEVGGKLEHDDDLALVPGITKQAIRKWEARQMLDTPHGDDARGVT